MTAALSASHDLSLNPRTNSGVKFVELVISSRSYFDSVGHLTWRGSHTLN